MKLSKNKVLAGVIGVLAIVSIVNTQAILKLKNILNNTENQSAQVLNNFLQKDKNIITDDIFEQEIKKLYPSNYLEKIYSIEGQIKNLVYLNNMSFEGEDAAVLRRFFCRLMGGTYITVGEVNMCIRINNLDFPKNLNTTSLVDLSIDNLEKRAISEDLQLNEFYINNFGESYNDKFYNLSSGIEKIFIEEEVDIQAIGGPGFRRFLCRVSGGRWTTFSTIDEFDIAFTVEGCAWGV